MFAIKKLESEEHRIEAENFIRCEDCMYRMHTDIKRNGMFSTSLCSVCGGYCAEIDECPKNVTFSEVFAYYPEEDKLVAVAN